MQSKSRRHISSLYHSALGLFDFQAEGIAQVYVRERALAVWDTGIGKSHLALATSAVLFEDDKIDHVVLVCEDNKLEEWDEDYDGYTSLTHLKYVGTPDKRAKLRQELPQVIVGKWETLRNDIAVKAKVMVRNRPVTRLVPGPLTEALYGKRVMVIWDEMTKIANRKSDLYKAHELFVRHLEDGMGTKARLLGLTATPVTTSPESHFNLARILDPQLAGTVAQFEKDHTIGNGKKDQFGQYLGFKNLSPDEWNEHWVTPLSEKLAPLIMRKRKTDSDVISHFPTIEEHFEYLDLAPTQKKFYDDVSTLIGGPFPEEVPGLITILRQIAAHPYSLAEGDGQWATKITEMVGADFLASLGSSKTDRLVQFVQKIVAEGHQGVVFSFFMKSIWPMLQKALMDAGIPSVVHHGAMSSKEREGAKKAFKAGIVPIFLTSDAGARGINLPEARWVIEYELALTHANRTQRLNRIHRINSQHPSVGFMSFVAKKDTWEERIADNLMERNDWHDQLLDDDDPGEDFISAQDRRMKLELARSSR